MTAFPHITCCTTRPGTTTTALLLLGLVVVVVCLLPSVVAVPAGGAATTCHGRTCHPVDEFCSAFSETCASCANICEPLSHNYQGDTCAKECPVYNKYEPLRAELNTIETRLTIALVLLVGLCAVLFVSYAYKCLRWLRHKGCVTRLLKKFRPAAPAAAQHQNNNKDLVAGATISNVMAINDLQRAPSHIYSVTGAEGSVMTMTTPVSTRYPAENTTPTTLPAEYSYDNQALAITPVSDKPSGSHAF